MARDAADARTDSPDEYWAKYRYRDPTVVEHYERDRFTNLKGRYVWRTERRAVRAIVERLPSGVSLLDCPCGNGRWWDVLSSRASKITGVDVSAAMLESAEERARRSALEVELVEGDAEDLPFDGGTFDYAFSHALTKHLPITAQARVLRELARVSRSGVICSFSIVSHLTYPVWRLRQHAGSNPMLREQLQSLAAAAGLEIEKARRCTPPIGVEHSVLLRKQ